MTQQTLPSYLNTNQEFEMCICDNDSRDNTWDYIQSLNDPRIIQKKRFDRNFGAINSINWTLTHRRQKQSFINVEYDAYNLTPNFVDMFEQVANEFGAGLIHAHYVAEQKKRYTEVLFRDHSWFCPVELPKKPPMSFCYMPYWVFDRLGYLDEATCLMDYEFVSRIVIGLKKQVGMTPSVVAWHIDYNDKFCPGSNTKHRVYPMLAKHLIERRRFILQERLDGNIPLKCGTYHQNTIHFWEDQMRMDEMELMANYYEEHLRSIK